MRWFTVEIYEPKTDFNVFWTAAEVNKLRAQVEIV